MLNIMEKLHSEHHHKHFKLSMTLDHQTYGFLLLIAVMFPVYFTKDSELEILLLIKKTVLPLILPTDLVQSMDIPELILPVLVVSVPQHPLEKSPLKEELLSYSVHSMEF